VDSNKYFKTAAATTLGTMAFDKEGSQFVLFGGMDAKKNPMGIPGF